MHVQWALKGQRNIREIPLFLRCQNKKQGDFLWTGSSLMFTVRRLISALPRWWWFSLLWPAIWGDANGHTSTSFISTAPLSLSASGAFNRCYNVSASVCVCVSLLAPHWRLMLRCVTQCQPHYSCLQTYLPPARPFCIGREAEASDRRLLKIQMEII